jgi:hypothetical protein
MSIIINPFISFGGNNILKSKLYTGTGSGQAIGGIGFQPDLLITRDLGGGQGTVIDSTNGVTKYIRTDSSTTETTDTTLVTSFDTNGFTLGTSTLTNTNTNNYVAWALEEKSDTFEIVNYTGTGSTRTVSHSLGAAPEMMLIKNRDSTVSWAVYHKDADASPATGAFFLDTNAAFNTGVGYFNDTAPGSSNFTVRSLSNVNATSQDYTAYLFKSTAGICKVGGYTGTGSGQVLSGFGFAPKWILIKSVNAGGWDVWDIANGNDKSVSIEGTTAQHTSNRDLTFDNDGVTINNTTFTSANDFIYLAFS